MKLKGIHHIAFITGDMDKTIRFWRDLLGARLVVTFGGEGYKQYFFELSQETMISFFEWPNAEPAPYKAHGSQVSGPVVFDHISFGVESMDELMDIQDRLVAAGFPVSEAIDHGFIHSIYSYDPNGIPIEFSTDIEGKNPRLNPKFLDECPSDIAREGVECVDKVWLEPEPDDEEVREVLPGEGSGLF